MFMGAWEILDRVVDGRVFVVGSAAYDQYLRHQLAVAFDIATEGARHAILLTTPCFRDTNESLGGLNGDRNDPQRIAWFNHLASAVAEGYGSLISTIDAGEFLCPRGRYVEQISGVTARPDGVHFGPEGAQMLWRWLAPQIYALAGR